MMEELRSSEEGHLTESKVDPCLGLIYVEECTKSNEHENNDSKTVSLLISRRGKDPFGRGSILK